MAGLLCAFWLFLLPTAGPARAGACAAGLAPARVAAVLDGLELALDDGRVLRIAGIDPVRGTPSHPVFGEDARAWLSRWLDGRPILVRPLAAVPDRWDRIPSVVYAQTGATDGTAAEPGAPQSGAAVSVAEGLLDAGWARVEADPGQDACVPALLAAEAKARADALGLWADPYYAVVDAEDRRGLTERTGAMVLVEGRVRLRNGRRGVLVSLGQQAGGLFIRVASRLARKSSRHALDLQGLSGVRVRVRGFLDDRFGLRLDLFSREAIEVLGNAGADLPGGRARSAQGD